MTAETALTLPDGRVLQLWRSPDHDQPDNLRAWDAADVMVLRHMAEHPPPSGRRLVVGDGFGALALGMLTGDGLTSWSDSASAHAAARANAILNGEDPDRVVRDSDPSGIDWLPMSAFAPPAPVVVVKVPKGQRMLEWQLRAIAGSCPPGTPVIGAGMVRHIQSSTVQAFESLVGPTTTTRAWRKARLVLATVGEDAVDPDAVDPDAHLHDPLDVTVAGQTLRLHPRPGVFGEQGLDDGTRLLLENLTIPDGVRDVVDLACGTGVVGLFLAARDPDLRLTFTDDSHLAVASARHAWQTAVGVAGTPDRAASFGAADGLTACADGSADLVVVNPPFHHGREVSDAVAWAMFSDARRVLRPGGDLVVVGNRHLGYHAKLKRLYGGTTVVASDPRFVVLRSRRR